MFSVDNPASRDIAILLIWPLKPCLVILDWCIQQFQGIFNTHLTENPTITRYIYLLKTRHTPAEGEKMYVYISVNGNINNVTFFIFSIYIWYWLKSKISNDHNNQFWRCEIFCIFSFCYKCVLDWTSNASKYVYIFFMNFFTKMFPIVFERENNSNGIMYLWLEIVEIFIWELFVQ